MARLASQAKGGFYPSPPEAVAAVLDRLLPPKSGECLVLDPAAGCGLALLQLADGIDGVPYGAELSEDRAAVMASLLDEGNSLAPADFLRTAISPRSFSMAYVNPNYDYCTGTAGRVESQFLHRAAGLLADGGVMCFVAPEDIARDRSTADFFEGEFEDISAMPFPAEVRNYNETIVMGAKRRHYKPPGYVDSYDWLDRQMEKYVVYDLPPGTRPRVFKKTEPTDAELMRLVMQSPLRFMMDRPAGKEDYRPRPPMSVGIGHRAMLLASGFLDGKICPPYEPPHVVRGILSKEQYISSCDEIEDDEGNVIRKTVISERSKLYLRVLDSDGTLVTLE